MAQGKYQARDIKGLTPAIDSTQSPELFALSGRNYVFDSLGVKSPFGNRYLSPLTLSNPAHMQGVRLRLAGGDRVFHFVSCGIIEWDEADGGWRLIYRTLLDTTASPYRWTFEYLNGFLYFAHPLAGLIVLNLDSDRCGLHADMEGIGTPELVIAVSQNNGRLGVLTQTNLSWSAPSDGLNFSPSFAGAGAQVLSERVAGDPIMLTSYARGFLTWTTGGVMRSEFSGDAAVYRHRTLNTEYRPINSFCSVRIDEDTSIILDERGLFQSRGDALTPYAPLFNEFLINFLQENPYRSGANLRLEWDDRQRRLYLSYSPSYADPLYESCFVYYPPLDKWGEFNESHYGIFPIKIGGSERADDYFGFADESGRVRYWRSTGSREAEVETAAGPAEANLYTPALDKQSQYEEDEDGQSVSSSIRISTSSRAGITKPEGYYNTGVTSPIAVELQGLDSLVRLGYIRLTGPEAADEITELTSAILRSVQSGDSDVLTEDFDLVPDGVEDEDYNVEVGSEDLGLTPLNYINHTFEVVGTIDGESEFQRVEPELSQYEKAARFYVMTVAGIWHIVEIGAEAIGEAFHLKTLEFTGTSGGRLL